MNAREVIAEELGHMGSFIPHVEANNIIYRLRIEGFAILPRSEVDAKDNEIAALREALANLVQEIDDLVSESDGVAGLHLNGDVAEWGDLLPGGAYERLTSLDDARAALKEARYERS